MRNLLFVIVFVISVSFIYADVYRVINMNADRRCLSYNILENTLDTLKVVEDTAFVMNMNTNNPFNGKRHFVINLIEIQDTSYCYPLINSKVISDYGSRGGRRHTGVDIKTKPNDSIRSAFNGVVVKSAPHYGYGNCIIIRHFNGIETLYSHNAKNFVMMGDTVKAGQVIALTGRTGRATTEHLHFECRIKGNPFDPGNLFDHGSEKLRYGLLKFTDKGGSVSVRFEKIDKPESL